MNTWNKNFILLSDNKWSPILHRLRLRQAGFHQLAHKSQKLLDLGCGCGKSLIYFKSKGYNNLYGVEPEEELIAKIPKGIAEIKQGKAEKIPYENETFDIVFIHAVLHHLPCESYLKACDEIDRVLKPWGFVFIIEPGRDCMVRFIEYASGVLGRFFRIFKVFNELLYIERYEQYNFIMNQNFFRVEFLRRGYKVIHDRCSLVF